MQIVKCILWLSCLLLLGSNTNGLTIDGILDCVQTGANSVHFLASLAVPELKYTAACLNFVPDDATNLDLQKFVDLIYKFFQRLFQKEKCLSTLIKNINAEVQPVLQKLIDKNCFPRKS
ncbi:uncharacterized protein LOC108652854 [Drosophila navojoa]|uniref:uncharacterized protein LOC108652854 n=1 Tax=Drosophila navojoa TaxID=7232 RepID=UPI000846921F|nr:uncharacterized protein LOC108652854 [Drosophila navojoa]